jgi:hypothetical protein
MKQVLLVICCLFALTQAGYVLQRMYAREDTKCEGDQYPFGTFFENKKCLEPSPSLTQLMTCNSTHVTQEFLCNGDCTSCQSKNDYPVNQCIETWTRMKFVCVEKLPELEKTGIYMRQFY